MIVVGHLLVSVSVCVYDSPRALENPDHSALVCHMLAVWYVTLSACRFRVAQIGCAHFPIGLRKYDVKWPFKCKCTRTDELLSITNNTRW